MDDAFKGLVAEGGLLPTEYMRDRRWQRAKLRYEIAKQRQAKTRSQNQLREEREQAWEEAHQRFDSLRLQAAAVLQDPPNCPACASMMAYYPTKVFNTQPAKDVVWWERPGNLVADHVLVSRISLRSVKAVRQHDHNKKASSALRAMIQAFREAMAVSDADKQARESRLRTELAVRRKHSLGEEYHFEPDFWDSPISAHLSLQNYQHTKDSERLAARRARGGTPRPKPPRSSLSHSMHIDELEVNESLLQRLSHIEESDRLHRLVEKVGVEVGYLYIVGAPDGLLKWRDDFLKSDRELVYRHGHKWPVQGEPDSTSEESEESEESGEDEEDEMDDKDEEDEDEDEGGYEAMDMDESDHGLP
jgi:hypothetical protein